jgi:hydroxyacylglutathione hydrolase
VLAGQPEPPRYFARMKTLNRDGAPPQRTEAPRRLSVADLPQLLDANTAVVDARSSATFASGYIRGTINIPAGRSFSTWAGWLLDPERDVVLIADGENRARELTLELSLIGLDRVVGWVTSDALQEWVAAGHTMQSVPRVDAPGLAAMEDAEIVDVRAASEWNAGHIPGARHIFLGDLLDAADELPRDRPLVIACQGGSRSSIAASLLRANGFQNVINFSGGFAEWERAGLPVESSPAVAASA